MVLKYSKIMRHIPLALAVSSISTFSFAAESDSDGIWERDNLFGDMGGLRSTLSDHGVEMNLRFSQFYQDVTSGGVNQNDAYGWKGDAVFDVDMHKALGTWEGLGFNMHVESRGGKDVLADVGPLVLNNGPLLFPAPGDYSGTDITGMTVSQMLFDNKAEVLAGKLQAFDLLNGFFPHIVDSGLEGFQNAHSFMSMLPWARYLTTSQYGAGAWTIGEKYGAATGILFAGGGNTATTWDTSESFDGGTGIMAFHRFLFEVDQKDAYIYAAVGGSTKDYPKTNIDSIERGETGNPWSAALYYYQVAWEATPGDTKRFVNIFTGGSIADDDVSFSDWDVFFNIQAFGLIESRLDDRMGFAASYTHLTGDIVDTANTILDGTLPGVDLDTTIWTTEIFYNVQLVPWLHLTPNIQYAQNANRDDDPAFVLGARLVIDF
jgi:porin